MSADIHYTLCLESGRYQDQNVPSQESVLVLNNGAAENI